jgi:hypothetical protein
VYEVEDMKMPLDSITVASVGNTAFSSHLRGGTDNV